MDMSPQEYQAYIKQKSPRSPIVKDTVLAFLIGGAICVLGQLILDGYRSLGLDKTDAGTATSVTLIFLAALTTGLNLYNSLARFAGAGTLVPITGFANSVVSPAIDFKAEGIITGMAAKMFVETKFSRVACHPVASPGSDGSTPPLKVIPAPG